MHQISSSSSPSSSSLPADERTSISSYIPATFPELSPESADDVEEAPSPPDLVRQQSSMSYSVRYLPRPPRRGSAPPYTSTDESGGNDTLSCVVVILTFWFFAEATEMKITPVLYGFYEVPPLLITKKWSESLTASVKPESHEEWIYFLNEGSQVDISYNVPGSSSLLLIIAKGIEEMAEWLEDPSYSDGTWSWILIHGRGSITQDISKSNDYYVAVGNLNSEDVEGDGRDRVYVKLSYEPRWMTYFLGIGGMTSVMLWVFNFLKGCRQHAEDNRENQSADFEPERGPLLSQKDVDLSSLGSSYDSGSQNDEESQECLEEGLFEGRTAAESGKKYNSRQCVICLDAPKDCFFIPCGHCASCFSCRTRIAEDTGICPICRHKIKKVRRIYSV